MKTVFVCLSKGYKKISKYIVFSIFSLAFLFASSIVGAAGYSNYDDYNSDASNHDNGVTPINGTLNNSCTNSQFTIIKSSYKGNNTKNATADSKVECISYTTLGASPVQYYYLQAQTSSDDVGTWNLITFQTHNISTMYKFIIVAEEGYSKSDTTKTDYDIYRLNETTNLYEYDQIRTKSGTSDQPDRSSYPATATYASNTYTFTYYLRNTEFTQHKIHVYFYDAYAEADNLTPNVTIPYTLAKPISDYSFNADVTQQGNTITDACDDDAYEVCLEYTASYNAGGSNNNTKTNTFTIRFSKAAAFYFSTVKSHKVSNITSADVRTYNSIYATNTFYNDGDTVNPIIYDYYNFKDNSGYLQAVTTTGEYNFTLTIDANGTYKFYITDIFGNTLTPETHADDNDSPVIDDVSNKSLTIYYLVYSYDGSGNITGVENYGDNVDQAVREFQLKSDSLATLTNNNVQIGLEFYSTVEISGDYAVHVPSTGTILKNPLFYENNLATDELRIVHTTTSEVLTYFCRLSASDSTDCITSNSKYTKQALHGTQSIAADNSVGKKAVANTFNGYTDNKYYQGLLHGKTGISTAIRNNRTNLVLNENGIFFVQIQDIFGNWTSSTISVSIIDQHNPVVTVNNDEASLANAICSNMYVVGAGGVISAYPEGKITASDCASTTVSYNKFEDIATLNVSTQKEDTIRHELTRTKVEIAKSNGFYDMASNLVTFNYADAIRMGLIEVSDSMIVAGDYTKANQVKKSYYQTKNATNTSYGLYTLDRAGAETEITDTLARVNYGYQLDAANSDAYIANSDLVILNNYTQYSSELKYYDADDAANKHEFVTFDVYEMLANGTYSTTIACNSATDRDSNVCNNIVNTYIDKNINFKMVFRAMDYVGNVSKDVVVEITVIDNTTPGIASINESGEMQDDPTIARNNIDTICRLEIGSIIQKKSDLLRCYGLLMADGTYNYVDNATGYMELTKTSNYAAADYVNVDFTKYTNTPAYTHSDIVYKKSLSDQLFTTTDAQDDSYYNHIKVYVCRTVGNNSCGGTGQPAWEEVTDSTTLKFDNAGSYEIKFEITDVGHTYVTTQTHTANKTVITLCYYVNPRVLLVRPMVKTVPYGSYDKTDLKIDYCVYATTNTDAFFYNLFSLKYNDAATYKDTYDFVDKNYENSVSGTHYGLVFCTNYNGAAVNDGSSADKKTLAEVLASDKAAIGGELGITYATGTNKYNMELTSYNAYLDAGYYYITMGDLKIVASDAADTNTYDQNYVLRLHPNFLLDGKDPNDLLVNYDATSMKELAEYKYGINVNSHGETISNVLYTVEQVKLTITANGGSKTYGNPDTNYPQASNTNAKVNVSHYTDKSADVSKGGYLNGFTIQGLIENDYVKDFSDTSKGSTVRYNHIIQGYLRRELGEQVGTYSICNSNSAIGHDSCDLNGFSKLTTTEYDLRINGNVYYLNAAGEMTLTAAGTTLRYGMYIVIGEGADAVYYKLTRDNTDLSTALFTNTVIANVWKYNYNDSDYSIKILNNDNNQNQNYYIEYVDGVYTINPGKLIVQPGSNQGKEYSNPQHNDPRYEIIIYGETRGITKTDYGTGFTGFTETIADVNYPAHPQYTDAPYNTGAADVVDNELYFKERRTTTRELFSSATFVYQFADVALDGESKFEWMGATYVYDNERICLATSIVDGSYTQCQNMTIGIYNVAVDVASQKVTISTNGALTYQTYALLTDESGDAGKAKIVRADAENINVGWYSYVFSAEDMHVVTNEKSLCSVTASYTYTAGGGTDACSNYDLSWDDSAPTTTIVDDVITGTLTIVGSSNKYLHNGNYYCGVVGDAGYSASCQPSGGAEVTKIKFFIFKRDVIISFNAFNVVYGNVYSYFAGGVFEIVNTTSSIPQYNSVDILTCYKKDSEGIYEVNGVKYSKITAELCNSVEHGISTSDYWGDDGLKLQFSLASYIQSNFTESTYPVPAGKYFVYATIGTWDATANAGAGAWLHNNYNLVYVDYNIIKTAESKNDVTATEGAVEITSREVTLVGTKYQKEYGQAKYHSYGANSVTGLTATNVGDGTYSAVLPNIKSDAVNKIYDNHYYHCVENSGTYNGQNILVGCTMMGNITGVDNTNYGYGAINNIFGYTVDSVGGAANTGMVNLAGGFADEIYANFANTPIRNDLVDSNVTTKDPYGLLADVGYYVIDLSNIKATVPNYSGVTFSTDSTMLRYTNYSIESINNGGLYITPATISIDVAANQTKMYGCAYNSFNNSSTIYDYKYGEGYTNCVEGNGTLYDLGYKYTVSNDKYNYLMSKVSVDPTTNVATLDYTALSNSGATALTVCELSDRKDGKDCLDIVYPTTDTHYKYDVSPSYTTDAVSFNKPTNTALNDGTLFRIPITVASGTYSVEYSYKDYFDFATKAQISMGGTGRIYQLQDVGDYALTLGNLDSATNGKKMCGADSAPVGISATYECKNFIINYDSNNTAKHVYDGSVHTFDNDTFTLDDTPLIFKITKRSVVLNTEYNYKVYGDTDPIEGFTCANLSSMFGLTTYAGRDYCSGGDDTFISTGASRYYAVDNSLAKAPWTSWSKDTRVAEAGIVSYNTYNDILFDVIDTSSQIIRKGEGSDEASRYDAGGKYYYVYKMVLNDDLNGANNYLIAYITGFNSTNVSNSTIENNSDSSVEGANVGFAHVNANGIFRWYGDDKHTCHSVANNGGNASAACDVDYTGVETYNFYIADIAAKEAGTYADAITYAVGDKESIIVSEVYFEIVHREIYIQTQPVTKAYGNEEDYLDFSVKLVTPNDEGTGYVDITYSQDWGDPQSLSKSDYDTFFPEGTFSLKAFMGTDVASSYRGGVADRAFGIYFYRTYGENLGSYVIVACATQFSGDTTCADYYAGLTDEATRLDEVKDFIATTSDNQYNASNYIVYTIPSQITITRRELTITPDSGQGFQYGNFVTGTLIDPITYLESSTFSYIDTDNSVKTETRYGLVNGGTLNSADHVNNQIAICIYDITGVITCINDRQNSTIAPANIVGYITTKLHQDASYDPTVAAGITTTVRSDGAKLPEGAYLLNYNVYNDEYTVDNDHTNVEGAYERYALNRTLSGNTNQRYNRNVGEYTINAGELDDNRYCEAGTIEKNCINPNYTVISVDTSVKYTITPAAITLTPKADQTKVYGTSDVEINFDVTTVFIYKDITSIATSDRYHCVLSNKCQSQTSFGSYATITGAAGETKTVTIDGFAYGENIMVDTNKEANHNYGISRVSNKSDTAHALLSSYTTTLTNPPADKGSYPKYYDKYCLGVNPSNETCYPFTETVRYSYLTYETTSRILLGYFYIEDYDQTATKTSKPSLNIMNGIVVALNEFGLANYAYTRSMGQDTEVDFVISKLKVDATIKDVTKVYGQATDMHKADAFSHKCTVDASEVDCVSDHAVGMGGNASLNNEGRLEYNFDVVNATDSTVDSVNGTDVVILTQLHGGHYYTQTGYAETKNVHLGLSVVREKGTACLITSDKYGCEDADEYKLVFRKVEVPNKVDENYEVTYGGNAYSTAESTGVYVHVDTTTIVKDELIGYTNSNAVSYIVYSAAVSYLDAIENVANAINVVSGYEKKLTITKRNVEFYIGTYDANGIVAERYIIEQNEEVPEFPILNSAFTTSTTTPDSKEIYYNTWFDTNEYGKAKVDASKTYAARQVRTLDNVITKLTGDDPTLGVGICSVASNDIQGEKYGEGNCTSDKFVQYYVSNTISGGSYVFDTSVIGDYAIVRDPSRTYITYNSSTTITSDYEVKNYSTDDYNGTLVIYEDQTAPIIQIGNNNFALEANANNVDSSSCSVTNVVGESYSYQCSVSGLRFTENSKQLGKIISYITENYSDYNLASGATSRNVNTITSKEAFKLPASIPADFTGWTYQPVNNIGNADSSDTLYKVDRTVNTYKFDDTNPADDPVINTRLEAISSIISFYNINSYDYGYIRNSNYITKRYTPRYYFFIGKEVDDEIAAFDPTYVGEFVITIYAIDNVGNQSSVTVTLTITDTTKPMTGSMYLFNAPVTCKNAICAANSINDWYVSPGFVPISAFTRYNAAGVVDPVNGTKIRVPSDSADTTHPDGVLVDIYSGEVKRYTLASDGVTYNENILGEYVQITSATQDHHILASEVEHKYWFNREDLYLVVIGGSDNSYIDASDDDVLSQWHTHYTVDDGTTWYKYDRHNNVGTKISFKNGVTDIYIRLMDEGRTFQMSSGADANSYYNAMYLSNNASCDGLTGCTLVEGAGATDVIVQVKDLEMQGPVDGKYTFKINALTLTYDPVANTVVWQGQATVANVLDNKFNYGIMSCEISVNPDTSKYEVDCKTTYNLLYKDTDKKLVDKIEYTFTSSVNVNDLDTTGVNGDNAVGNITGFYKDRRYVYVDTVSPEILRLNGDPFSLYEYKTTCQAGTSDDRCKNSYEELFLAAKDSKVTTVAGAVVDTGAIAVTNAALGAISASKILYTGNEYVTDETANTSTITSFGNMSSGLLSGDPSTTYVMYGGETYDNAGGTIGVTFNKHNTSVVVYMVARKSTNYYYYRFTAVFDGTRFRVYRQSKASTDASYAFVTSANITAANADIAAGLEDAAIDTTEEVVEFIASTASIAGITDLAGAYLDFSINYVISDVAGNKSAAVNNLTVRGVTYVRYESEIAAVVDPAVVNNIAVSKNNTYEVEMNQGASLVSVLSGFKVTNVDHNGVNHVSNLKQSLYYNGEAIFENIPYDMDIISYINGLAAAPGVYTLKVTNTREVDGKDGVLVIDDIPLILNINVKPNVASATQNNYAIAIFAVISMFAAPIAIIWGRIISKKKRIK